MKAQWLAKNPQLIIICLCCLSWRRCVAFECAFKRGSTATSVNIVNNSSREIRNVYLSHVDADDWGGNQLGDATIAAGQSFNLSISPAMGNRLRLLVKIRMAVFFQRR